MLYHLAGRRTKILGGITMEKVRTYYTSLFKKYHILCGKLGMTDSDKKAFLSGFGVSSSKEMTESQLREACNTLSYEANKNAQEADMWRKRVLAATCQYIDNNNIKVNNKIEYAKGIAVKASGCKQFNDIQIHKLQLIYNMMIKSSALHGKVEILLAEACMFAENIKKTHNLK